MRMCARDVEKKARKVLRHDGDKANNVAVLSRLDSNILPY
jgi:hypothetical protein